MMAPITETESVCVGNQPLNPHPDGKPWTKCCRSLEDNSIQCQCFMKKPPANKSRFQIFVNFGSGIIKGLMTEKGRFFCVHRSTDDGFHRECAGWAAKITGNRP